MDGHSIFAMVVAVEDALEVLVEVAFAIVGDEVIALDRFINSGHWVGYMEGKPTQVLP